MKKIVVLLVAVVGLACEAKAQYMTAYKQRVTDSIINQTAARSISTGNVGRRFHELADSLNATIIRVDTAKAAIRAEIAAGAATWGNVGGDINDQTDLQTALGLKQNTITGAATTITTSNLTASRVAISGTGGKIEASGITTTNLNTLSGITSNVQTQLDARELLSNKSTSTSLGTSNTLYPSQNAVKVYVDAAFTTATTPPGSNTEVIFNDNGVYGTSPVFTYSKTDTLLNIGALHQRVVNPEKYGLRVNRDIVAIGDTIETPGHDLAGIEFYIPPASMGGLHVVTGIGQISSYESIWSWNLRYHTGGHQQWDPSVNTNYIVLTGSALHNQIFKPGGNYFNDGKVTWTFENYNCTPGNFGSLLRLNRIKMYDPTESNYFQSTGPNVEILVDNPDMSFVNTEGIRRLVLTDSLQLNIGGFNGFGLTPIVVAGKTGGNTEVELFNRDNNTNHVRIRADKSLGSSYNIGGNQTVVAIDANTIANYSIISNAGTFSGLSTLNHNFNVLRSNGQNYQVNFNSDGQFIMGHNPSTQLTTHASAAMDIQDTGRGLLPPRWTTTHRTGISSPAKGLFGVDTTLNKPYMWDGTTWVDLTAAGSSYTFDAPLSETGGTVSINTGFFIQNQNSSAQTGNAWISGNYRANGRIGVGVDPLMDIHVSRFAAGSEVGQYIVNTSNAAGSAASTLWGAGLSGGAYAQAAFDCATQDFRFTNFSTTGKIEFAAVSAVSMNTGGGLSPRLTAKGNGIINITVCPEYTDNADAIANGLVTGDIYRTGDNLKIVH